MALVKIQKTKFKNSNLDLKVTSRPVVNQEKTGSWKNLFGVFSQFVAIGGDFA